MSAVDESMSQRMTLGRLASHHGFDLVPDFASSTTVTSLADTPDSVRPGALYVPGDDGTDAGSLAVAASNGAYAMLVPHAMRDEAAATGVPLLLGEPDTATLGAMASSIAGSPSSTLAVFAVCGADADEVHADVVRLADFLHMLGNPVGTLSQAGSSSLERGLRMDYPAGVLDVQHALAVSSEDGVAAMVIAVDDETLRPGALNGVSVDVLGSIDELGRQKAAETFDDIRGRYGFQTGKAAGLVTRTEESGWLAGQGSAERDMASQRRLSLCIAMALCAGVKRGNIRNALRVSRELR
ncbi:UDP-N-acetylmuramyl peptide synthase [Bifidobacterium sp. ESL0763]|uniref:UDP-N-acetylmuramyl peptide synthase n=1 Tax=Bifidobacterium sp. ESL0763 TaxID=2983227 RepID=UPI0023F9909A|nr:UDP-N-acetylmuramyl peptide synthase [Bifidobacterium sp. ESL0763]MDF7664153.1 UDP-N-acetylmuramyl peptide synthase [Bifidobacterium sp. ESL0763]